MFSGIIRNTGKIINIISIKNNKRLTIETDKSFIEKLETEITSVSINGACHTVESKSTNSFTVFSSFETLKRTNIGLLNIGNTVNLELPMTPISFFDGHIVQGHVDGLAYLKDKIQFNDSYLFIFELNNDDFKYLTEKDSIAIDGISLTIFNIKNNTFSVAVIPSTIKHTTLNHKSIGDAFNYEINIFAKYAYNFLKTDNKESFNEKLEKFLKG